MDCPVSEVVCRNAIESDVPRLTELLQHLFAQEADFTPDPARQRRALQMILRNPHLGHILVAAMGDDVVGMVSLLYVISTAEGGRAALLEDMIVAPEKRGGGIGGALLKAAIAFARQQDCRRITLLTDADNEGSIRLYTREGFQGSRMTPLRLFLDVDP